MDIESLMKKIDRSIVRIFVHCSTKQQARKEDDNRLIVHLCMPTSNEEGAEGSTTEKQTDQRRGEKENFYLRTSAINGNFRGLPDAADRVSVADAAAVAVVAV
jgi:hypothetical protein